MIKNLICGAFALLVCALPGTSLAESVKIGFVTTLTTALGLLPIIAEQSPQAQFLVPMAVSLGAGLVFASITILMLLPALVMIVDDVRASPLTSLAVMAGLVVALILLSVAGLIGLLVLLAVGGLIGWRVWRKRRLAKA